MKKTDTLPQNILCLTFTENGAANMRERLTRFIGKTAYDVKISTYHAFGSDIIAGYREYFADQNLENPIDDLGKFEIVSKIVEELSYRDPLKSTRYNLKNLIDTISEMKRGLVTSDDMRQMAAENQAFTEQLNTELAKIFAGLSRLPGKLDASEPLFLAVQTAIRKLAPKQPVSRRYGSLADYIGLTLELALVAARDIGKSQPLTKWKDKWLAKDKSDNFILNESRKSQRLASLADIFDAYEAKLNQSGLYDFDDMILKAIAAIKANDDLRFSLQERFQYILLDEYQDTNAAQAELIGLLADNPVHEGRPNIMAVGDDDQAIYAFQGAEYSNMLDFYKSYLEPLVVNLSENYRSHNDILETASAVAGQIESRLFHDLPGTSKKLVAQSEHKNALVERRDFRSSIAENEWVAQTIKRLIDGGANPRDIAVLAPKHELLENCAPFIKNKGLPLRYEKRENILDDGLVKQILAMARLVSAVGEDETLADSLWPEVLSAEWWGVAPKTIWTISRSAYLEKKAWTEKVLDSEPRLAEIGQFFAAVSQKKTAEPFEKILDYLLGNSEITIDTKTTFTSPLRDHVANQQSADMVQALSNLTVLRQNLRDHQQAEDKVYYLADLLTYIDNFVATGQPMLNTSPYVEAADAVQLMTVYKAKGLEFGHVFLLGTNNENWGKAKGNSNRVSLPANLSPTRYDGGGEDERLRLLFVAITRAKHSLYLTNHTASYSGKQTTRLKFLDEREDENGRWRAMSLPTSHQTVVDNDEEAPSLDLLQTGWFGRHLTLDDVELREFLNPVLENYQLSPTHLNTFCDLEYGGPAAFFANTILKFPSAPTSSSQFGNAIHETLEWIQHDFSKNKKLPSPESIDRFFDKRLESKRLDADETARLHERGVYALSQFINQRGSIFEVAGKAETAFRDEGVFVGSAHLDGKIDRLEVDEKTKTIVVVDYKTGKPYSRWESNSRLHKYQRQLYCYKLLVEGSHAYAGYTVTGGRLEFIEPDENEAICSLNLKFKDDELARTKQLLEAMWQKVKALDMPDVSSYQPNYTGTKQFEDWLVSSLT